MIRFNSDYTEGAHPLILKKLMDTNSLQTAGYGMDEYCKNAADLIREKCGEKNADIHFLVGGTQANMTVISSCLRSHQGVIAANTGHISVHETGAVENLGHKVLTLCGQDGKLNAKQIEEFVYAHQTNESYEHMVQPKMVYLSNPTELGTIYKKAELTAIHQVCKKYGLYLYLDGARLGYGLSSKENDLALTDLGKYCDVFYIGGTKIGALFGEAVVIVNDYLKEDFRYHIKQKGGMLAKGRLLGIQFMTLFEDDLYFKMSAHAIELADYFKEELSKCEIPFYVDSPTNQQFIILPNQICEELKKKYEFSHEANVDEARSAVRFCTSWATKREDVEKLVEDIKKLISCLK